MRTLVLGGNRSGKSAHAESLLADAPDVVYAATSRIDAADAEWADRIRRHRERRPSTWSTDESTALAALLAADGPPLLIDSITTWLSNTIDASNGWDGPSAELDARIDDLCTAWAATNRRVVAVSDEVGLGIVPETPVVRRFRDELGSINQRLAGVADEVHLVIAGQVLRLR